LLKDPEQSAIWLGCIIVAVILHEISHGIVALWFGDDTAKKAGRLTLNPIPHIDPFGSIILPVMGALTGIPFIAWAKPVPVNPNQLRAPRRDMLWVGLAGPFTNFALMAAAALTSRWWIEKILADNPFGQFTLPLGFRIVYSFALINLFLGLFNLLPIPPLDGSSLLERFLPDHWLPGWYRIRPYGMIVLFVLVFSTHAVDAVLHPFEKMLSNFVFPLP